MNNKVPHTTDLNKERRKEEKNIKGNREHPLSTQLLLNTGCQVAVITRGWE